MNYFQVVLLASLLIEIVLCQNAIEYIITSNPNASCNNCLTLSQFAANSTDYLSKTTTLVLQPGNFTLELTLKVSDVEAFSIQQNSSLNDGVVCNHSGKLLFTNVQAISISNLSFKGCFDNKAVHVKHLTLSNTRFVGTTLLERGTALEVIETEALLSHCVFSKYYYGSYHSTLSIRPDNISLVEYTKKWIGGAMIILHSNVTIAMSNFSGNRAQQGGAIYAENGSVVVINTTTFKFNTAASSFYFNDLRPTAAGGALYVSNCSVHVYSSYFESNNVYFGNTLLGGAISLYKSLLHITGSVFRSNQANKGGVAFLSKSSAVFANCKLEKSSVSLYGSGGVLFILQSSISLYSCNLTMNHAPKGGIVDTSRSAIIIQNCSFTYNSAHDGGGVIHSRVQSNISVMSCLFKRNHASDGAVMYIIRSTKFDVYFINISNCRFIENRAEYEGGVFSFNTYTLSDYSASQQFLSLKSSIFLRNYAGERGGVLYVQNHNLIISDIGNTYINNSAKNGGVNYVSHSRLDSYNSYFNLNYGADSGIIFLTEMKGEYSGITFHRNRGSALVAVYSDIIFHGNINFTENEGNPTTDEEFQGGAIIAILSIMTFDTTHTIFKSNIAYSSGGAILSFNSYLNIFSRIMISNNRATVNGGGLHLYQSELICKDQVTFIDNIANSSGGGIYLSMSFVHLSLKGSLLFMRNFAKLGGGVYFTKYSKISGGEPNYWASESRVRIIHNTAFNGGGIYVDDTFSCGITVSRLKQECFFHSDYSVHDFDKILIFKYLFFNLNEAKGGGSNIFGGIIDRCLPNIHGPHKPYLLNLTNIKNPSITISSQPVRVCFCKENKIDCGYQSNSVNVTKGQDFSIELVAVDQIKNSLKATIHAYTASNASGLGVGQQSQTVFEECTNVTYRVYSEHSSEKLILYADGPCKNANFSSRSVHINFLPCRCATGFMRLPDRATCKCICHKKLDSYLKNCNSSTKLLLRNTNAWMDTVTYNGNQDYLIYPHCPYDYCYSASTPVYINLSSSGGTDAQCSFNRSGVLCGACKQTLSIALGSSQCLQCSNIGLVLFIPFCLAGIALVVSVLWLNMTISKGTINAIIFYSNIVIVNRPILIPFNKYNVLEMIVSWISLDLGIETCFMEGLDTYGKMWLQFLFPIYIFGLVISIIISSQYSQRLSNLLGERNPIATLVTLIWLSNAKLFRTILSAVSFTFLQYPDNTRVPLWLPDGNIHYLRGKHIPLFIAAILVFIVAIGYVAVLLLWQWIVHLQKYKVLFWIRNTRFVSFMDAHHASYKGKYRYWLGLVLLVSIVQYSISAFNVTGNPAVNLYAIIVLVTTLTVYKGSVSGVYRKWPLDVLETTLHLNLILFAASTLYVMHAGGNQIVLANVSLSIFFLTFITILGYHVILLICSDKLSRLNKKLNFKKQRAISIEYHNQLVDDDSRDSDSIQLYGDADANYYEMSSKIIKPHTSAITHSEVGIS